MYKIEKKIDIGCCPIKFIVPDPAYGTYNIEDINKLEITWSYEGLSQGDAHFGWIGEEFYLTFFIKKDVNGSNFQYESPVEFEFGGLEYRSTILGRMYEKIDINLKDEGSFNLSVKYNYFAKDGDGRSTASSGTLDLGTFKLMTKHSYKIEGKDFLAIGTLDYYSLTTTNASIASTPVTWSSSKEIEILPDGNPSRGVSVKGLEIGVATLKANLKTLSGVSKVIEKLIYIQEKSIGSINLNGPNIIYIDKEKQVTYNFEGSFTDKIKWNVVGDVSIIHSDQGSITIGCFDNLGIVKLQICNTETNELIIEKVVSLTRSDIEIIGPDIISVMNTSFIGSDKHIPFFTGTGNYEVRGIPEDWDVEWDSDTYSGIGSEIEGDHMARRVQLKISFEGTSNINVASRNIRVYVKKTDKTRFLIAEKDVLIDYPRIIYIDKYKTYKFNESDHPYYTPVAELPSEAFYYVRLDQDDTKGEVISFENLCPDVAHIDSVFKRSGGYGINWTIENAGSAESIIKIEKMKNHFADYIVRLHINSFGFFLNDLDKHKIIGNGDYISISDQFEPAICQYVGIHLEPYMAGMILKEPLADPYYPWVLNLSYDYEPLDIQYILVWSITDESDINNSILPRLYPYDEILEELEEGTVFINNSSSSGDKVLIDVSDAKPGEYLLTCNIYSTWGGNRGLLIGTASLPVIIDN